MSHATYIFLLLALTWNLITPNRQSILRDTSTAFSLPPVTVSLRIEHWCYIFRWTCSPNVNTKQMLGQVWQCHVYVANNFRKQQWGLQWRSQATHVGSSWSHWPVKNQHGRAGEELLSHDKHARKEVKGLCECPEALLHFSNGYKK